jgi:NAD(P)-dependent dehydrogenase (short-subunit alcohol dehydrogenase family)
MDLGIQGRIALIGASGRGLGLATAQRLALPRGPL